MIVDSSCVKVSRHLSQSHGTRLHQWRLKVNEINTISMQHLDRFQHRASLRCEHLKGLLVEGNTPRLLLLT